MFWFAPSVADAAAFVIVMAVGDTAGEDEDEATATAAAEAAVALDVEVGKCPEAALSDLGCAKRTPWYITELISRDTTNELSPESPGKQG